jgi:hypothetical protein
MVIFTWIVLGIAGVLLLVSGLLWALFLTSGTDRWRKAGVKVFRIAVVFVLLEINTFIYVRIYHIFYPPPAPPPVVEEES